MLGEVLARFVDRSPKLQDIETHTSAALVRYSARRFAPLIEHVGGAREPWLPDYQVKIVDGNA